MKRILFLFVISFHLQLRSAVPFSAGSFTAFGSDTNGIPFLREYTINGTLLQEITLPNKQVSAALTVWLDSAQTTLLIPMSVPTGSPADYTSYLYTINSQGQIVDYTSMNTGTVGVVGVAMDGQDVWMSYSQSVAYLKRGDTSATVASVVAADGGAGMNNMQLVGSRLYIRTTSLKFVDPILKTGTSTVTALTGLPSGFVYFYFHKSDTLYILAGTVSAPLIIKYSVSGSQATEQYRVTAVASLSQRGIAVMEADGVTYVVILLRTGSTVYSMYQYNDNGSAFVNMQTIYSSSFLSAIGPSPKPTCSDGFLNQDETDIDCGGATCSACADDKTCSVDSDCANLYCTFGKKCATPLCTDGLKNGKETDVDCGGSDCIDKCDFEQSCKLNSDCKSNLCVSLVCATTCADGIQNQQETDVDCGGPNCNACVDGKKCLKQADCSSNYCNPNFICSIPSCIDGWKNQNETDIDCGGICSSCQNGASCIGDLDCVSITCSNYHCVDAPPVAPPMVNPPVALPVSEPVAAPIDGPVSDQSPQSLIPSAPFPSTPSTSTQPSSSNQPASSAPVKQTGVSAGAVVEISLAISFINLLF